MRFIAALAAVSALLAGCEYAGPPDNAVARNLTWFSYLGGENIEKSCAPGAPDRYRFVYNGIYQKQIRSYDVSLLPGGRGASVSAFARGEGDLTQGLTVSQIGAIWGGTRAQAAMSPQGLADLRAALAADGMPGSRPSVLRLPSNEFYWTAAACIEGQFHTNAWLWPSERFMTLKFPAVLLAHDRTGIELYESRPFNKRDDDPTMDSGDKSPYDTFVVQLGPEGFVSTKGLF